MTDSKSPPRETDQPSRSLFVIIAAAILFALLALVLDIKLHHRNTALADTQKQLTQAKSEAAQAQNDLKEAQSSAADLQTQLTKAKAQAADFQAQVAQGKDSIADQQAQLDRDKAQATDLQAQLDKSKAQAGDLQAQLNQATAGSAQLLTQLDQAKIQTMDLQTRLQTAESDLSQLQPLLLKTGHLPVTTAVEKASGGYVLHVHNLYAQPLTVSLTITGSGRTRSESYVIGAGATQNVRKLSASDNVAIASQGYDPVNVLVE